MVEEYEDKDADSISLLTDPKAECRKADMMAVSRARLKDTKDGKEQDVRNWERKAHSSFSSISNDFC